MLFRQTVGEGPRNALLIHGLTDDSTTWWQITPWLVERGFTVASVDLSGHGMSPRLAAYDLSSMLRDLLDAVPEEPNLVIGHSLGGVLAMLAHETLNPEQAVYLDPAWNVSADITTYDRNDFIIPDPLLIPSLTVMDVSRMHPLWSDRDIEVEISSWARWDSASLQVVKELRLPTEDIPAAAVCGSAIITPEFGSLVSVEQLKQFERLGYVMEVVMGAGHVMHRDQLSRLKDVLDEIVS